MEGLWTDRPVFRAASPRRSARVGPGSPGTPWRSRWRCRWSCRASCRTGSGRGRSWGEGGRAAHPCHRGDPARKELVGTILRNRTRNPKLFFRNRVKKYPSYRQLHSALLDLLPHFRPPRLSPLPEGGDPAQDGREVGGQPLSAGHHQDGQGVFAAAQKPKEPAFQEAGMTWLRKNRNYGRNFANWARKSKMVFSQDTSINSGWCIAIYFRVGHWFTSLLKVDTLQGGTRTLMKLPTPNNLFWKFAIPILTTSLSTRPNVSPCKTLKSEEWRSLISSEVFIHEFL